MDVLIYFLDMYENIIHICALDASVDESEIRFILNKEFFNEPKLKGKELFPILVRVSFPGLEDRFFLRISSKAQLERNFLETKDSNESICIAHALFDFNKTQMLNARIVLYCIVDMQISTKNRILSPVTFSAIKYFVKDYPELKDFLTNEIWTDLCDKFHI